MYVLSTIIQTIFQLQRAKEHTKFRNIQQFEFNGKLRLGGGQVPLKKTLFS